MDRFDDDVLDLMPHIVSLRARLTIDRYNRATYEPTATRYRALVVMKNEQIRTITGEEAISRVRITMSPVVVNDDETLTYLEGFPEGDAAIKPEHEITLPDGSKPVILALAKNDSIEELQHMVIHT